MRVSMVETLRNPYVVKDKLEVLYIYLNGSTIVAIRALWCGAAVSSSQLRSATAARDQTWGEKGPGVR